MYSLFISTCIFFYIIKFVDNENKQDKNKTETKTLISLSVIYGLLSLSIKYIGRNPFITQFITAVVPRYKTKLLSINPKRLVYPVPNPINPFLGVHTTITLNNELKIGPTAFPVIGKEQYRLIDGFNIKELFDFLISSKALLKSDSVNLLDLAKEEAMKLFTKPLLKRTRKLSSSLDSNKGWVKYPSGIRAQVINTKTKSIEMDYIVKADKNVVHILNAVSPGWTSSLPFARWVVENQPLLA
jgi:L-2-hydroxyglutarate oxidase LhgO